MLDTYEVAEVNLTELPNSREAEEATLGAVIISPETFYEMSRIVSADDFFIHRNKWIWEAIETLIHKRAAVDIVTVCDELENKKQLSEIGGQSYITHLMSIAPYGFGGADYAQIVFNLAQRRKGIQIANRIAQKAYDKSKPFELSDEAMALVKSSRGVSKRKETTDALNEMIDLVNSPRAFTFGVQDVDDKIGGLFPDELSVLAGYQGTGKTAAKLQGARENAKAGKRILLVDLEMTASQTWFRMSCADMGIDMNKVRSDKVSDEAKGNLIDYAAQLAEYYKDKIVIYQAPMTLTDILNAVMMEQPDLVYIDTLKNLAGKSHKESKQEFYDNAMTFLRVNIAQQAHCHVQVLHHINRSSFKETRKPSMHDLMFAGESDPDQVFLLYRKPEDYELTDNSGKFKTIVPISVIVDKSRFGWTGEEEINFNLAKQSFYGMSRRTE